MGDLVEAQKVFILGIKDVELCLSKAGSNICRLRRILGASHKCIGLHLGKSLKIWSKSSLHSCLLGKTMPSISPPDKASGQF